MTFVRAKCQLGAFYIAQPALLPETLWGRNFYYSHFTDGESETSRLW